MSKSTDGQICFGIKMEAITFPWDEEPWLGDEAAWWRSIKGYKPLEDDTSDAYYEAEANWEEANPMPVVLVNYCSLESPLYIVAVRGDCNKTASRGYPEAFDPLNLIEAAGGDAWQTVIDFCNTYLADAIKAYNDEEYNDEKILLRPKWYLSSYWG